MKIFGGNRSSKSRSVSLVGMFRPKLVVHDFNPPLVTIAGPRNRFSVNWTHLCKGNTIAERNVPNLSFVYHLIKCWTDRVTNLGSLENTSGSILTSKATPQAAKSSSVEQAITDTDSNTKSRHAHYKHFHRFNFDCLTKVKKGYVYPVVHSLRNA